MQQFESNDVLSTWRRLKRSNCDTKIGKGCNEGRKLEKNKKARLHAQPACRSAKSVAGQNKHLYSILGSTWIEFLCGYAYKGSVGSRGTNFACIPWTAVLSDNLVPFCLIHCLVFRGVRYLEVFSFIKFGCIPLHLAFFRLSFLLSVITKIRRQFAHLCNPLHDASLIICARRVK